MHWAHLPGCTSNGAPMYPTYRTHVPYVPYPCTLRTVPAYHFYRTQPKGESVPKHYPHMTTSRALLSKLANHTWIRHGVWGFTLHIKHHQTSSCWGILVLGGAGCTGLRRRAVKGPREWVYEVYGWYIMIYLFLGIYGLYSWFPIINQFDDH